MKKYENMNFDEERALYASRGVEVTGCRFDGPADGESALKESRDVKVKDCYFNLRYPFWHNTGLEIDGRMENTDLCFEKSDVEATVITKVDSIKNPRSGRICVPSLGKLIMDDPDAMGEVVIG